MIWVTFMGRSLDERADEILVTDYRPSGVKRDSSYRVIINLDTMEDYTAAPLDVTTCFHPSKTPLLKPCMTTFNCVIRTIDGAPPPTVVAAPALRDDVDSRARRHRSRGNDHPRLFPRRRNDDDDDRRGRRPSPHASGEHGSGDNLLSFRRERTRSPHCRDSDSGRHGHRRGLEPGALPASRTRGCSASSTRRPRRSRRGCRPMLRWRRPCRLRGLMS